MNTHTVMYAMKMRDSHKFLGSVTVVNGSGSINDFDRAFARIAKIAEAEDRWTLLVEIQYQRELYPGESRLEVLMKMEGLIDNKIAGQTLIVLGAIRSAYVTVANA